MPGDRIPPLTLAHKGPQHQPKVTTMSRPSSRQLAQFQQAMADAQAAQARIPSREELAARRDAYLASLR